MGNSRTSLYQTETVSWESKERDDGKVPGENGSSRKGLMCWDMDTDQSLTAHRGQYCPWQTGEPMAWCLTLKRTIWGRENQIFYYRIYILFIIYIISQTYVAIHLNFPRGLVFNTWQRHKYLGVHLSVSFCYSEYIFIMLNFYHHTKIQINLSHLRLVDFLVYTM